MKGALKLAMAILAFSDIALGGEECSDGCSDKDSTCQVWETVRTIREKEALPPFIDDNLYNAMINRDNKLANREKNM